jgi:hypothetical protein
MGTAAVGTGVYLKRLGGEGSEVQVLGFSNKTAYPIGTTAVSMSWLSDADLVVTYNQNATLNFHVDTVGGVNVGARQITSPSASH